jgi:hypothetical protein
LNVVSVVIETVRLLNNFVNVKKILAHMDGPVRRLVLWRDPPPVSGTRINVEVKL